MSSVLDQMKAARGQGQNEIAMQISQIRDVMTEIAQSPLRSLAEIDSRMTAIDEKIVNLDLALEKLQKQTEASTRASEWLTWRVWLTIILGLMIGSAGIGMLSIMLWVRGVVSDLTPGSVIEALTPSIVESLHPAIVESLKPELNRTLVCPPVQPPSQEPPLKPKPPRSK